jgi:hypothetical protein
MSDPMAGGKVNPQDRELLREWVRDRHSRYIAQAVELARAQMRLSKENFAPSADLSYTKLRRLREEYEEARRTLTVLDQAM